MAQDRLNCIHHWIVNAHSVGNCIKCGDRRDLADIQTQDQQEAIAARATAAAIRRKEAHHNS